MAMVVTRDRIIPADAGSTNNNGNWITQNKDHPRGCGEHASKWGMRANGRGSSPRMRGARETSLVGLYGIRIIPADAGSTPWRLYRGHGQEDHPRGCGEHLHRCLRVGLRAGSSPRMRGAHRPPFRHRHQSGIIPADAGSTSSTTRWNARYQDHPRGCGEHRRLVLWRKLG